MTVRQLVVDGITVPVWSTTGIQQSYEPQQAVYRRRTADGALVQRSLWSGKLRTVIAGNGFAPSGLQEVDTSAAFEIWCVEPIAINSALTTVTIPANRRVDTGAEPLAFAVVGIELVPTTITNLTDINAKTTNDAILQSVAGAAGYQVRYFPVLTVMADPIRQDLNRGTGFGWRLEAEEV